MTLSSEPQKVALVLASGGARGLAHIGVIRELEKNGFVITSIAGSSVGALIGGIYASGKLDAFTDWICTLDQIDVIDLMDFTLSSNGFIKAERLFYELQGFLSETVIEKLPIPYVAIAADLITRREVFFYNGNLIDAIRASVAIPTIITPVVTKGMVLVDGGVINPIPANAISRHMGDILVVSDINANKPYIKPDVQPRPPKVHEYSLKRSFFEFIRNNSSYFSTAHKPGAAPGYIDVINKTFDIMQDSLCLLTKQNYHPDINIEISREAATTFEFHRAEELMEAGRIAFYEALKQYYKTKDII
jgi:NTE family protein